MTITTGRPVRLEDRYELRDGQIYLSGIQALVRIPSTSTASTGGPGSTRPPSSPATRAPRSAASTWSCTRSATLLDEHRRRPPARPERGAGAPPPCRAASSPPAVPAPAYDGVLGIWYGKAPGPGPRGRRAAARATWSAPTRTAACSPWSATTRREVLHRAQRLRDRARRPRHAGPLPRQTPRRCSTSACTAIALSARQRPVGRAEDRHQRGRRRRHRRRRAPTGSSPVIPDVDVDGAPYEHAVDARRCSQPVLAELERSLATSGSSWPARYAARERAQPDRRRPARRLARHRRRRQDATSTCARRCASSASTTTSSRRRHPPAQARHGLAAGARQIVREFADGLDEILVVEEKRPFVERRVKELLYGGAGAPARPRQARRATARRCCRPRRTSTPT